MQVGKIHTSHSYNHNQQRVDGGYRYILVSSRAVKYTRILLQPRTVIPDTYRRNYFVYIPRYFPFYLGNLRPALISINGKLHGAFYPDAVYRTRDPPNRFQFLNSSCRTTARFRPPKWNIMFPDFCSLHVARVIVSSEEQVKERERKSASETLCPSCHYSPTLSVLDWLLQPIGSLL